jgi:DNA-binding NtrC family response regulator
MTTDLVKTRLLVVDDDPMMCDLLRRILVHQGYGVRTAEDAEEAIDQITKDESICAVITDIRMPGKDGKVLMKEILNHRPEMKVILMTAYGGSREFLETTRSGAAKYLLKPLNPTYLVRTVRNMVGEPVFSEV